MSLHRDELSSHLNELLDCKSYHDLAPNGLQVEGLEAIESIALAVSASLDAIEEAAKKKAQALIVHHGILWDYHKARPLTGAHGKRARALINSQLNLYAYHLPLDGHPSLGNAAGLAQALGLEQLSPFGLYKQCSVGIKGVLSPTSSQEFKQKLQKVLNHSIVHACPANDPVIKSVGIITGGANNDWEQAHDQSLDAYITGEISEYNWHDAREHGLHFFAGGHTATEVFGVQQLMGHLKKTFGTQLKSCFYIESDNPV